MRHHAEASPDVTCGTANTCGITDTGAVLECPDAQCGTVPAGDRVAAYVTQRGNTTYVTYTSNGLPLTNLIRAVVPFGNVIADLTEPVLTEIVNSAYPNGNPIPADPSKYQPATPFSSLPSSRTAAKIPGAIQQGLTAATGSAPKTTSKTAITAAEPTRRQEGPARRGKAKPLTNVVREATRPCLSPGSEDPRPRRIPLPPLTSRRKTSRRRRRRAQSGTTSGQQSASSGTDAEAGKS